MNIYKKDIPTNPNRRFFSKLLAIPVAIGLVVTSSEISKILSPTTNNPQTIFTLTEADAKPLTKLPNFEAFFRGNFSNNPDNQNIKKYLDILYSTPGIPDYKPLENFKTPEPPENESYINYVLGNGFSEDVIEYIDKILDSLEGQKIWIKEGDLNKEYTITKGYIKANRVAMQNNIKVLLLAIIHIETNGLNVNSGITTAKGYGQLLDGSTKYALRKAYMHYSGGEIREANSGNLLQQDNKDNNSVPEWIIDAYNEKKRANELSAEQQTILIMAHTLEAGKQFGSKGDRKDVKELLAHIVTGKGGAWAIKKIYEIYHHTNLDMESNRLSSEGLGSINKRGKMIARMNKIFSAWVKFII